MTTNSLEIREHLAIASRVLHAQGGDDLIYGHASRRDPEGRGVWMKGSGLGFGEVTAGDIILVSADGDVLWGERPRHIEYPIHVEILAARADVGAVVHTHWPATVAFSSLGVPLRAISHDGALFAPDVARFTLTGDLITDAGLGAALAEALGPANAILLVHHGLVTVGADLETAVITSIALERACSLQLAAMAAGGPADWSSDEESFAKREKHFAPQQVHSVWNHLVRQLEQQPRARSKQQ